mmetsp:Transcript_16817/g.32798  ORF Transcript_16817/g.32798 Transcript_16817/m.32798 type:complete len:91 (-) Transcript_16817:161-433(-)
MVRLRVFQAMVWFYRKFTGEVTTNVGFSTAFVVSSATMSPVFNAAPGSTITNGKNTWRYHVCVHWIRVDHRLSCNASTCEKANSDLFQTH